MLGFRVALLIMLLFSVVRGVPSAPTGGDFNINGVGLGMSRAEVAAKFSKVGPRKVDVMSGLEFFGQAPGYHGAGNSTWVKFDQDGSAFTVEGFNLFRGSTLLAGEFSSRRSVQNSRWFKDLGEPLMRKSRDNTTILEFTKFRLFLTFDHEEPYNFILSQDDVRQKGISANIPSWARCSPD